MNWFKFYGQDFLSDMKMWQLSIAERLLWVTLLCLAHEEGRGGEIRYCTEALVKSKMGLQESDAEWRSLDGVFDVFEKLEMIRITDNGVYIKNFQKRQNTNLTDAEKMARHRKKVKEGNESYPGVVTDVTPNRIDKNRIDKNIPPIVPQKGTGSGYPKAFETFWLEYPRKVGKGAAFKAWQRIKDKNVPDMIDAVRIQRGQEQWRKDNGQYIPHPATWLNQRRWEDEARPMFKPKKKLVAPIPIEPIDPEKIKQGQQKMAAIRAKLASKMSI